MAENLENITVPNLEAKAADGNPVFFYFGI